MKILGFNISYKRSPKRSDGGDPLVMALENAGITVNPDTLFEVECHMAMQGQDNLSGIGAAEVREAIQIYKALEATK